MRKRMRLSYKDRKYEPDVRNTEKQKKHRRWLISELLVRYGKEDSEVIWFDEKGFQTLDSEKKRWQLVGMHHNSIDKIHKIQNLSLLLAMTKNRVVAYQWVVQSVSHVEIYHFWQTVLTEFPIEARNRRMDRTLPENLRGKDSLLGWTIMMDNARIHHHASVVGLLEEHGMDCIWNVPYSPQLMPVENLFAMVSRFCKGNVFNTPQRLINEVSKFINAVTPQQLNACYQKSLKFYDDCVFMRDLRDH